MFNLFCRVTIFWERKKVSVTLFFSNINPLFLSVLHYLWWYASWLVFCSDNCAGYSEEKLKSDVDQISSEESSQHNYQNRMLFSFVWLFRRFHQAIRLWNSFDVFWYIEILKKIPSVFWLYSMKKIFILFLAKSKDSEPFSKNLSKEKFFHM